MNDKLKKLREGLDEIFSEERETIKKDVKYVYEKKIDNLEDQLDKGEIDYDDYEGRLKIFEADLEKAKKAPEEEQKPQVKKIETSEEDADKEVIKNEKGSISSDKVQKIYEEKYKLEKPIWKK
jgi:hypothetical protein